MSLHRDSELPFSQPDADTSPPLSTATPRRHRHDWGLCTYDGCGLVVCRFCHTFRDPVTSRRGRTSLRAGKDAERAIAKAYGGRRTGHFGGPDDVVVGDLFIIQSKAGGWFSQRVWDELVKLPRAGGRIPTLIVSDRPGPGHPTRRYVVRMLSDDVDLHGPTP